MAGAVRLAPPPQRSFARLTGVLASAFRLRSNHFLVSSHQPPQMPQKNRLSGDCFMAGAVRLASPPLHSFAYAHRRSGIRLSFAVEPLSREFSSTAQNATKKPPKRRLFYGRGSKIRTHDTRFWRPMLYQLSYTPIN